MTRSDALTLLDAEDGPMTTHLAMYLNAAMARNAPAQVAYARIYGSEWEPLGCGAELHDGPSSREGTTPL